MRELKFLIPFDNFHFSRKHLLLIESCKISSPLFNQPRARSSSPILLQLCHTDQVWKAERYKSRVKSRNTAPPPPPLRRIVGGTTMRKTLDLLPANIHALRFHVIIIGPRERTDTLLTSIVSSFFHQQEQGMLPSINPFRTTRLGFSKRD